VVVGVVVVAVMQHAVAVVAAEPEVLELAHCL
jgi:hypothetical protein